MAKGRRNSQRQPLQPKSSLQSSTLGSSAAKSYRTCSQRIEDGPPIASITPPKHVPIPEIPRLQEITFELFMFLFSIVSLGLQYLNLYKTVFWLPQSYTKYAMHFHLIDTGLVYFIITLLGRRLVWSILRLLITRIFHHSYWKISLMITRQFVDKMCNIIAAWRKLNGQDPNTDMRMRCVQRNYRVPLLSDLDLKDKLRKRILPERIVFMISLCGILAVCFIYITSNFNLIRIIALFYPFTFYVFKFNLEASAFFEVIPSPIYNEEKSRNGRNGRKNVGVRPVHHLCVSSSEGIRAEVNFLKEDCNKRIAQVIFQTIMVVHYTAVVPCIFAPNSLYYDYFWVKIHTFFVGTTSFVWHLIYCFPSRYCDILHRSALHLGGWSRLESRGAQAPFNTWVPTVLWPQGAHVKYLKEYYKAEGITNAAEPGNSTHARLYSLFNEPWRLQLILVVIFSTCSLLQLAFLITLHQWQQVLATALVLAASYAGIFILFRDYLVLKKVYSYEQTQQGKSLS